MNRYDTGTPRLAFAALALILSALTLGMFCVLPAVSESAASVMLAALPRSHPPIH